MPDWLLVILLISIGMLLFLLEILTPGFGLAGISGIVLLGMGIFFSWKRLSLPWALVSSIGSLTFIAAFLKIFPKTVFWKRMRLDTTEAKVDGFISASNLEEFINKEGLTVSALRPTGVAIIEGKRMEVTSEGLFIPKGKKIEVIRIEGNRLIVREKSNEAS